MVDNTEAQRAEQLGQRIEQALQPRVVTPAVSMEHLHREMSRMYDEGFNEAAVIAIRGGDLLQAAHSRLKSTHGQGLAAEIAQAHNTRRAAQCKNPNKPCPRDGDCPEHGKNREGQTQAAPSPDYGSKEQPFGSPRPVDLEPERFADRWESKLSDWLPNTLPYDRRLSGVRLGDVHLRLEAERRLLRSEAEVARLRAMIDILQRTIRDLAT